MIHARKNIYKIRIVPTEITENVDFKADRERNTATNAVVVKIVQVKSTNTAKTTDPDILEDTMIITDGKITHMVNVQHA